MDKAMDPFRYRLVWEAVGLLGLIVVIYASLTPNPPGDLGWSGADKVAHLIAYGALMGWSAALYSSFRARAALAVSLVVIGLALEWLQYVGGARTMSAGDAAANTLGVAIGWLLAASPLGRALAWVERWLP